MISEFRQSSEIVRNCNNFQNIYTWGSLGPLWIAKTFLGVKPNYKYCFHQERFMRFDHIASNEIKEEFKAKRPDLIISSTPLETQKYFPGEVYDYEIIDSSCLPAQFAGTYIYRLK